MNRNNSASRIALVSLSIFGLAVSTATAGESVPFKGRLAGDVTITRLIPPYVHVDIDAQGNATLLGQFQLEIPHLVNRDTMTADGTYDFTSANGDTLSAEFSGESELIAPGLLYIEETATVTGGTGRFAGASGSFRCERLFDMVAGTTVGYFEGAISAP